MAFGVDFHSPYDGIVDTDSKLEPFISPYDAITTNNFKLNVACLPYLATHPGSLSRTRGEGMVCMASFAHSPRDMIPEEGYPYDPQLPAILDCVISPAS